MSYQRLRTLIRSDDPEIRRQTVARSAQQWGDEGVDLLMEGLADEDWRVRKEAVQALMVRPPEPYAVKRLVEALHPGENVGLRNAAVEALGGFGTLAVAAVVEQLSLLDADGRKLAAEALARTNHVAAFGPLAELVEDKDPNVRAAAIEALADVGRVAPEVALPILESALNQKDTFALLVTLDAIRRLGLTPSWYRLRPLLAEPMLLQVGLQLAATLGEPFAAPYFVKQLGRTRGQTWSETLVSFAGFIEKSRAALTQSQLALRDLPQEASERLLLACRDLQEPDVSSAALLVLAVQGREGAAEPALELLGDDRVAAAAHRALEILGPSAMESLRKHLVSGQELERTACVQLLASLAAREDLRAAVLETLRGLASDESPSVARAWLAAASQVGDEAMFEALLPRLSDQSQPHVRRAAVSAVRACAQRFPAMAKRVAQAVTPDSAAAAAVATFISALDEPLLESSQKDLEFLTAAVSNTSVSVRVSVLSALSGFSETVAADAVAFALSDESEEVKLSAVRALGRMRDRAGRPLGTSRLIDVAQSKDATLVVAALQALGEGCDPAALPTLTTLVAEPTPWRAVAATEALGAFGSSERAAAMQTALAHVETEVVKAALEVLAKDKSSSEGELVECLSHPAWDVRRLAADGLARSGQDSARMALKSRLAVEREPLVVEAIRRGLSRFESPSSLLSLPPDLGEIDT